MRFFVAIALLLLSHSYIFSQDTLKIKADTLVTSDTLKALSFKHVAPNKAALHSALIPGWGQFNNRSYWKVPIAAGGVAAGISAIVYTGRQKNIYGEAVQIRIYDTTQLDKFFGELTTEQLLERRHRYNGLNIGAILGTVYAYGLNIMDAYAEAQVSKFPDDDHYPVKAVFYSALLPGLGQAYNRKYWKIPIAVGAVGVGIYFIADNSKIYNDLRSAYITRIDEDPATVYETNYTIQFNSLQELQTVADEFKRFRDISFFVTTGIYLLNIIDAVVDAHLYNFNIDDDLSMNISPDFDYHGYSRSFAPSGVRLSIKF